jgi:hypothetical protein
LQKNSLPDPADPFGGALGRDPGNDENDSFPGQGLRAGPFDDGIIPFGSFAEIHPK